MQQLQNHSTKLVSEESGYFDEEVDLLFYKVDGVSPNCKVYLPFYKVDTLETRTCRPEVQIYPYKG